MDTITLMIAKSAGKLFLKLGREGLARLLSEPLLQKAASETQLDFKGIEIRDTLIKWSQTEDLVEILDYLREGKSATWPRLFLGFSRIRIFQSAKGPRLQRKLSLGRSSNTLSTR